MCSVRFLAVQRVQLPLQSLQVLAQLPPAHRVGAATRVELAGAARRGRCVAGEAGAEAAAAASRAALRSRYSSIPPGRWVILPSPNSAITASATRSIRYRSWLTTSSVPGQESSRSSSADRVSVSRSLVGSSSTSTFGSAIRIRSNCNRRRSPPDRSATRVHCWALVKPNRSAS